MGKYLVKRSKLAGEIVVPPSKSQTMRAILFGALGKGKSYVQGFLDSADTQGMIKACRLFGAKVDRMGDVLEIRGIDGKIGEIQGIIDAGNSGIVLRFCSAVSALGKGVVTVTGDESIRNFRLMEPLMSGLSQLGVSAVSTEKNGYAPIVIQGPIKPGKVVVDGEDSQPVSALLIASAFGPGPIELKVKNSGEKPWVNLTLDWFCRLGISFERSGFETYWMQGNSSFAGFKYQVPGDVSSAAFPIAAAIITGSEILLKNVDLSDPQGDRELIRVFQKMGAHIEVDEKNKTVFVKKGVQLKGIDVDINDFVDGIVILAVVACFAKGETVIYNGAIAKQKECNRIACIVKELKKMGADLEETADGLKIRTSLLKGAKVNSYHDHRMAMALGVAALGAEGETSISPVSCIAKTYPDFFNSFRKLGAQIEAVV